MRDEMKKVPRLRFRGFSEEWEQCKAEELCKISTGKGNTQDKVENGKYPFYVRSENIERSNYFLYDQEAVLTVGDGVGTGRVFHYVSGKYNLHQRVYRMYDFNKQISAKYFYYYFSLNFLRRVRSLTAKTFVDSVRLNMISDMEIKYPSELEQLKIFSFLDYLIKSITLHQRKLEQLKELKKAYLQLMFPTKEERVPKLRFADFEGEWELCKLIGILDIIKGTQKSKSELSTNQNNCTPYPVYNGGINPSGYTNIYNRENAITISEGGNSAGFVNFVQEKFFSGGHNYTIVNNVTDTLFLFFYLCSIQEEIMRLRVGTGLPNIQKPTLMNLEIQKTTDNEQKFIGLFLKNIDILITLTQNKLNQLKSLKKSYLQNMFI
ncbi:restriction endonuclease subunit S [Enterococcus faecalis]|nr:restriction endonuclease subunit S [Enterococcus faecalis]